MKITKQELKRIILEELNEIEDELAGDTVAPEEPYDPNKFSKDELAGDTVMPADEPDMEKHIRRSKALGKVTQVLQKLLSELT